MKILHLTSDWKWTGSAEPMLLLIQGLRERGHEVELVCPEPRWEGPALARHARERGIEPLADLPRGRGIRPLRDALDARRLRRVLESEGAGLLHVWHTQDHVLGLRTARRRRAEGGIRLVRSWRSGDPVPGTPWDRWLFEKGCDGLLCVSPGAAERNQGLLPDRPVVGCFGAVDLERFRPVKDAGLREKTRAALGLRREHRAVGIVARAQKHRRFELLFDAMQQLAERMPDARLVVVGRGTDQFDLHRRAADLGLRERVVFTGWRGDDYPDVLRALDLFTFLVPGSDGTCRAVLEAAACGLPAVVTGRGALPEIVLHGETGRVVEETPEALATAWAELLGDDALRGREGARARWRARQAFGPGRLVEAVEKLYASVAASSASV